MGFQGIQLKFTVFDKAQASEQKGSGVSAAHKMEFSDILTDSSRYDQDMDGGGWCGWNAILSQVNPREFGGNSLRPGGNKVTLATAHAKAKEMKRKIGVGEEEMLATGSGDMTAISNLYKRDVVLFLPPNGIGMVFGEYYIDVQASDLKEKFLKDWRTGKEAESRDAIFAILLQNYGKNGGDLTNREVITTLLRKSETIGLIYNSNHFRAASPR
ncbi:MAG: hypothetical protein LBI56_04475 [Puniceicoccales bacterium]|jgi:hypothetical protein|nr:hypothetical protein [Puniceicoccales bacterium]